MVFSKDELLSSFARMHGKYEFTRKQARVLDEYMNDLCTVCMLDSIKEWDYLTAREELITRVAGTCGLKSTSVPQ